MYIMCVCLFGALSRRVGALQTSIIIITCRLVVVDFMSLRSQTATPQMLNNVFVTW